jgi:hypothetical protein
MWNGRVPQITYPHLFSFALNKDISLKEVLGTESLQFLFSLPFLEEAFMQFTELEIALQAMSTTNEPDAWSYIWGSGNYSSQKAYKHLTGSNVVHPVFNWIWASCSQMKYKVFYWLLVRNRLNTRGPSTLLQRRLSTAVLSCHQIRFLNHCMCATADIHY